MIPAPTEQQVETALVAFLTAVLPTGVDAVRGQINRVAEPNGEDFVVFWPLRRVRLRTNVTGYDELAQTASPEQGAELVYQLDVHGPNSADNAAVITTMWRDNFAVLSFATSLPDPIANDPEIGLVAPLHADEPRQVPFVNAEEQYEDRWVIEAHLQVNQTMTTPQPSADVAGPVNVEVPVDALTP